jgi:hypothetical protein
MEEPKNPKKNSKHYSQPPTVPSWIRSGGTEHDIPSSDRRVFNIGKIFYIQFELYAYKCLSST